MLLRRVDAPAVARVALSDKDKAQHVVLTDDDLGAQSSKARSGGLHPRARTAALSAQQGYRTVRCTHGVATGAWYCEVRVVHLGATGHARLGWCASARGGAQHGGR